MCIKLSDCLILAQLDETATRETDYSPDGLQDS